MTDRYTKRPDGSILDTQTGLEWDAETHGPMQWQRAMDYARDLWAGGHDDWRLPTIAELVGIVDYTRVIPATTMPGMSSDTLWSSSSHVGSASGAWYVYFYSGYVHFSSETSTFHVRCVRRGKRMSTAARNRARKET
jgi:hypothetical protein